MNKVIVSIAIPLYNPNKNFIKDLIVSINNQTYKDLEICFSDDSNSFENIEYLLTSLKFKYKYIYNNTQGIFNNLNNAIDNCEGNFIQIFCQDDFMYPTFIESQVNNFEKNVNIGLSFSEFDYTDDFSRINKLENRYKYRLKLPNLFHTQKLSNYLFVYGCITGNLSPIMIKKDAYLEIGKFNQDFQFAGDFDFITRLSQTYNFYFNKIPMLAIRRHQQQASNTLGSYVRFDDIKIIYMKLLSRIQINKSPFYIRLSLNEQIGRQFAYLALIRLVHLDFKNFLLLKSKFSGIFNFMYSFIFIFITFNGKFKIFKISEKSFRKELL
jgi:glycosyltransferase involved in cell wall biosynthesis